MARHTFLKLALLYVVIILVSVFGANRTTQADIVELRPLQYLEFVQFYPYAAGDTIYGQDDNSPELLPFGKTYSPVGSSITVNQQGYVRTALEDFPLLWIFTNTVPVIEIQNTASVSSAENSTVETRGYPLARGLIYFDGVIISASGVTRDVPVDMDATASVEITVTGKGHGNAKATFEVRELKPDLTYGAFIFSDRIQFCKQTNLDYIACKPEIYLDPQSVDIDVGWYHTVAPGAFQRFEVRMIADCFPHITTFKTDPDSLFMSPSSMTCKINLDPFVYIDPEWEYADEYTLELSPGMFVGPPPKGSIFPWPMFLPAIIGNQQ